MRDSLRKGRKGDEIKGETGRKEVFIGEAFRMLACPTGAYVYSTSAHKGRHFQRERRVPVMSDDS